MALRKRYVVHARDYRLALGERTCIMGILNVTPDSFSGDGVLRGEAWVRAAVRRGMVLAREGADILDIGGESTRPGASVVSLKEEMARVVPVIQALAGKVKIPISVDTYKPEVAAAALAAGASIVNVIQGTPVNRQLLKVVRKYQAGLILMHMRGTPKTMQGKTKYHDLLVDVSKELKKSVEKSIEMGIKKDSIVVDPGIGFAKTTEQNLFLINRLDVLASIKCPILVGPSRKSFIGATLGLAVSKRLIPTAAAMTACILRGAHIVRVHDVREMKQVAILSDALLNAN